MGNFFGNATSMEHTYLEDGEVETDEVENVSVETPDEVVQPEVVESEEPVAKTELRGRHEGGQDYTYYGNF